MKQNLTIEQSAELIKRGVSGKLFEWLCFRVFPADWLKTKLRVYDTDPD